MKKIKKLLVYAVTASFILTSTAIGSVGAAKKAVMSKKSITITAGKTQKLSVSNAKKVSWSSNKPAVASVSKAGVVTGKKPGKAVIFAKAGKQKMKCKVQVKALELKKVELDEKNLELCIGEDFELAVVGTPKTALLGQKVTWSSSNDEVVDVDDGDVIALEEGTATITVTVGSRTASCVVTVVADDDEYDYDDDESDYSEGGECLIEADDDTEE